MNFHDVYHMVKVFRSFGREQGDLIDVRWAVGEAQVLLLLSSTHLWLLLTPEQN